MKLFINTTSPYARIVRIAILEKGLDDRIREDIIDPWGNRPNFVGANLHERVPALLLDDGTGLAETSIILHYLETIRPDPTLYPASDYRRMMSLAGIALGAVDVMAAIIITRKSAPDFDANPLGRKRFRTVGSAFDQLNATLPPRLDDQLNIASIATAVAVDYAVFRFRERDFLDSRPALRQWREDCRGHGSLVATMPYHAE
ncbi:glutathione S-transferase family protein [Microbaculum sp. FT89]|uniref:glutathione S-transferase family protein n=1 Tax=Microbaculum sp. FT89 TaxID=3447298 RepID=UPI003F53246F